MPGELSTSTSNGTRVMPKVSPPPVNSHWLWVVSCGLASAIFSHRLHLKPALVCPHLLTLTGGRSRGWRGAAVIEQLFKGGTWETGIRRLGTYLLA